MIDQEKLDWMAEVGIIELKRPLKFLDTGTGMLYSEDYLNNAPLERVKAGYVNTMRRRIREIVRDEIEKETAKKTVTLAKKIEKVSFETHR